jgi:hypothetical protein
MISELPPVDDRWNASELRELPPSERDAILAEAAVRAEHEYRTNLSLTDYEAFGEDDLHGTSTATPTG